MSSRAACRSGRRWVSRSSADRRGTGIASPAVDPTHAHLRAFLGAVAGLPGGALSERDGVRWCRTPIQWPMFNGVIATPELGSCDAAGEAGAALAEAGWAVVTGGAAGTAA